MKVIIFMLLFSCCVFADTTVPEYPEMLNVKEFIKTSHKIEKLQTEEVIIEHLKEMRKEYKKIKKEKFDLNQCPPREKSTYDGLFSFFSEARKENKDVVACEKLVKEFIKDAKALLKGSYKKVKKQDKKSKKYLEEMIEAAEEFQKKLKYSLNALSEEIERGKESVARSIDIMKANAKNFIDKGLEKGLEFVFRVQDAREEERANTFNEGIQKVARDLTQNISNILKYKKELGEEFRDIDDLDEVEDIMVAWGNDGRKVGQNGGRDDVEEELVEFQDTIDKIAAWYRKQ